MVRKLILGDLTFLTTQMLPSFSYNEVTDKNVFTRRTPTGALRTQSNYKKIRSIISGLSLGDFPDLDLECEKDQFIYLSSIKPRMEKFSGDGATTIFYISRETRLDTGYKAQVEHPAGTLKAEGPDYSIANVNNGDTLQGEITFSTAPASGTDNLVVTYYPYLLVCVTDCNTVWDDWKSELVWQVTCLEA